jgi:hypothetical protein
MIRTLIFSFLLSSHPVHVSVVSVEYMQSKQAFNLYVELSREDFGKDYDFAFPGEIDEEMVAGFVPDNKQAERYITSKIQIIAGDANLPGVIDDVVMSDDKIKINMSYSCKIKVNIFTVRNSILTELYSDQTNMLIFKFNDIEEGVKLSQTVKEHTFAIK